MSLEFMGNLEHAGLLTFSCQLQLSSKKIHVHKEMTCINKVRL